MRYWGRRMNEADYVERLPDPGENRKIRYDWRAYTKQCRAEPGKWSLVASSVPRHAAERVRRKEAAALRALDGVFEASIRNGRGKRGELWMRFVPYSDEELARIAAVMDEP